MPIRHRLFDYSLVDRSTVIVSLYRVYLSIVTVSFARSTGLEPVTFRVETGRSDPTELRAQISARLAGLEPALFSGRSRVLYPIE